MPHELRVQGMGLAFVGGVGMVIGVEAKRTAEPGPLAYRRASLRSQAGARRKPDYKPD